MVKLEAEWEEMREARKADSSSKKIRNHSRWGKEEGGGRNAHEKNLVKN